MIQWTDKNVLCVHERQQLTKMKKLWRIWFVHKKNNRYSYASRDIKKELDVSVRRIIKTKVIKQFKRLKTLEMNDAARTREVEPATVLLEKNRKKSSNDLVCRFSR